MINKRLSLATLEQTIENYKAFKKNFEVHHNTNTKSIVFEDTCFKAFDKEKKIEGAHLIKTLRKCIDKKLATGLLPPVGLVEPLMDFMNIENIKNAGLPNLCTLIDLNVAYWTAAWKLGYLDADKYFRTFTHKEWKHGMTSAVGVLNRSTRVDTYVGGVLVDRNKILLQSDDLKNIRLHIINHVADIMRECGRIAGADKWVKVHVDAITMHPMADMVGVKEYLSSLGFGYKWLNIILNI
jgi:hypothetical protein